MQNEALIPRNSAPPEVEIVDVDDPIPTDAEVVASLREIGLVKMTDHRLRLYDKLGAHQNSIGILKGQRGLAFVNQRFLTDTIELLHRLLAEGVDRPRRKKGQAREEAKITTEHACLLAHEISFAAGKVTESQELMNKLRPTQAYAPTPLPNDEPKVAAFPAGAIVAGGNATVHIHQQPQKPVEKTEVGP